MQALPSSIKGSRNKDLWIADSGASTHLTFDDTAMTNVRKNNVKVIMGNSSSSESQMIDDVKDLVYSKSKSKGFCATLADVAHTPTAKYNLFSLTCMLKKGWTMIGNEKGITLTKGDVTLNFDHKVETSRGCLFVIKLVRLEAAAMALGSTLSKPISIVKVHKLLTHCGEANVRKTCKHLGIESTIGTLPPCIDCELGKSK